jgi:hypothetical protein
MVVALSSSGTQHIEQDIEDLVHVVISVRQTCANHRDNVLLEGISRRQFLKLSVGTMSGVLIGCADRRLRSNPEQFNGYFASRPNQLLL